METRTIMHDVTFNAAPEEVFEALMDSAKHSAFTGAPATIARKAGGVVERHTRACRAFGRVQRRAGHWEKSVLDREPHLPAPQRPDRRSVVGGKLSPSDGADYVGGESATKA